MASIYEIHFPITSSGGGGGGGSSLDRFGPKYLVGNTAYGDPDTTSVAGLAAGFNYFPDPGDCSGIRAALAAAAVNLGDVYIRPGSYLLGGSDLPLDIPCGIRVQGSGDATVIFRTVGDQFTVFQMAGTSKGIESELRDVSIFAEVFSSSPEDPAPPPFAGYGAVQIGGLATDVKGASLHRVNVTIRNQITVGKYDPVPEFAMAAFYVGGNCYLTASECAFVMEGNGAGDPRTGTVGIVGVRADTTGISGPGVVIALDKCTFGTPTQFIGQSGGDACVVSGYQGDVFSGSGGKVSIEQCNFKDFLSAGVVGFNCDLSVVGTRIYANAGGTGDYSGIYLRPITTLDGRQDSKVRVGSSSIDVNKNSAPSVGVDLEVLQGQIVGSTIAGATGISSLNATGQGVAIGFNTVTTAVAGQQIVFQPVDEVAHNILVTAP